MSKFLRITKNTKGVDYFLSDPHGCYTRVDEALKAVGFDQSKDRLFVLGDLVDRGPESYRALDYLEQPWFISLQGNHDAFVFHTARLLLADDQKALNKSEDAATCVGNGGTWIIQQPESVLKGIVDSFKHLPIAIEYVDENGEILAGLVHAEVDHQYTWEQLREELEELPSDYVYSLDSSAPRGVAAAIWGRKKFNTFENRGRPTQADALSTKGVPVLVCGHNIAFVAEKGPFKIGNNRVIDHGICKKGIVHLYTIEELLA